MLLKKIKTYLVNIDKYVCLSYNQNTLVVKYTPSAAVFHGQVAHGMPVFVAFFIEPDGARSYLGRRGFSNEYCCRPEEKNDKAA